MTDPFDIRHLVVLAHPSTSSFNHGIADAYCRAVRDTGQTAVLRDLYAMGFDPVLQDGERAKSASFEPAPDVAEELALIEDSAVITMICPLWFGMPPAMLKGYVDRVLGAGFLASQLKPGEPQSILRGKRLMIFTTSASTRPWLDEMGQWMALRQAFDSYLRTIFAMEGGDHLHFDAVTADLKDSYARECLADVEGQVRKLCSTILSNRRAEQVQRIRAPGGK